MRKVMMILSKKSSINLYGIIQETAHALIIGIAQAGNVESAVLIVARVVLVQFVMIPM